MVKVLLVDDSAAVRSRLAALLAELREVEVVGEAADSTTAVEAARLLKPHVVILDIRMAGGSGLDVLPQLKQGGGAPVVIMLTNHPNEGYRRWCLEHGADFFFDKSTEFEKVLKVLPDLRPQAR